MQVCAGEVETLLTDRGGGSKMSDMAMTQDLRAALRENPITGLTYRTAARWVEAGLVQAEGGGAQGRDHGIGAKQLRELRTCT